MKKIIIGHGLEQRAAVCNFCEQDSENCIKGSLQLEVSVPNLESVYVHDGNAKFKYVCDDVDFLVFAGKVGKDPEYQMVIVNPERQHLYKKVGEDKVEKISPDICFDCIKQLSKLIQPDDTRTKTRAGRKLGK